MTSPARTIAFLLTSALILPQAALAAGGGSTPEAVFDNFKTAMKTKDYKTGFAQMTPDSQDMILGQLAIGMSTGIGIDPAKAPEAQKFVEKQGVKKVDVSKLQAGQDPRSIVKESLSEVKDKPACFADLMSWMETNAAGKDRAEKIEAYARAQLVDVKTENDTATGVVKVKHGEEENSSTMAFKSIGGAWYIDLVGGGPPARAGGHASAPKSGGD